MKTYGGVDVQIHVFLTSALVEVDWSASFSGRFTLTPPPPKERAASTRNRSWRRGEKSCPYRDSNFDPSAVQPVASPYTDFPIPALSYMYVQILSAKNVIRTFERVWTPRSTWRSSTEVQVPTTDRPQCCIRNCAGHIVQNMSLQMSILQRSYMQRIAKPKNKNWTHKVQRQSLKCNVSTSVAMKKFTSKALLGRIIIAYDLWGILVPS
jgi:hypothetical protein